MMLDMLAALNTTHKGYDSKLILYCWLYIMQILIVWAWRLKYILEVKDTGK